MISYPSSITPTNFAKWFCGKCILSDAKSLHEKDKYTDVGRKAIKSTTSLFLHKIKAQDL
jgi:hypothetical protein